MTFGTVGGAAGGAVSGKTTSTTTGVKTMASLQQAIDAIAARLTGAAANTGTTVVDASGNLITLPAQTIAQSGPDWTKLAIYGGLAVAAYYLINK